MRSAPLYNIERRISAVIIKQGDSGWMDTSPEGSNNQQHTKSQSTARQHSSDNNPGQDKSESVGGCVSVG